MNTPFHIPCPSTGRVGYAWLADRLGTPVFPGTPVARIDSVMSLRRLAEGVMLVPARMAPQPTFLGHILFALKHEGVNLQLLARAAPRLEPAELLAEFTARPNSAYIRKTCYLWEHLTGRQLEVPADVAIGAAYATGHGVSVPHRAEPAPERGYPRRCRRVIRAPGARALRRAHGRAAASGQPARELCQVRWAGDEAYWYDWSAEADKTFCYPDLTHCVEFTLEMAKTALEHDLRRETRFLSDFDEVYRQIDDRWDIRNPDLSNLILFAFQNRGLSKHRRKQYADRVPAAALDAIEAAVLARLPASEGAAADPGVQESAEPDGVMMERDSRRGSAGG